MKDFMEERKMNGIGTIQAELLTIPDVCKTLNICRAELGKLRISGKFAPLPVPLCRKVLFNREELQSWLKSGCVHRKQWQTIRGGTK